MQNAVPPVFEYLLASSDTADYRLLDVQLVDVLEADDGMAELVVECQGLRAAISAGAAADDVDRGLIGQVGALSREVEWGRPASFRFEPYADQTLRRAPELDGPDPYAAPGTQPRTVGWRCSQRPGGLRAPVGVIPGIGGAYVEDGSQPLQLQVPAEFAELCRGRMTTAEAALTRFMGDACDLDSTRALPRADGLNCGSHEAVEAARHWVDVALPEADPLPEPSGDFGFDEPDEDPLGAGLDALIDAVHAYVDAGGDAQALAQELGARTAAQAPGTAE